MVTYEITASVADDLVDDYERYMQSRHIPDVLATGAFSGATFSRSAHNFYRIRYESYSREMLDKYLAEHAPRLREHFALTFPRGVDITREEWDVLATW